MSAHAFISMPAAQDAADILRTRGPHLSLVADALFALTNDTDSTVLACEHTPPIFDNGQAWSEGWTLSQRSDAPSYAIETLDDPESVGSTAEGFENDEAAWHHVLREAALGSPYHRHALYYLGTWAPEALDWVLSFKSEIRIRVKAGSQPHAHT